MRWIVGIALVLGGCGPAWELQPARGSQQGGSGAGGSGGSEDGAGGYAGAAREGACAIELTGDEPGLQQVLSYVSAGLDADRAYAAAVAVVQDGKLTYARLHGSKHPEVCAPVGEGTRISAAVGEQVLALAAIEAQRRDLLDLREPIRRLLPGLKGVESDGLTLLHLLSERSGLASIVVPANDPIVASDPSLEAWFAAHPPRLLFAPGTMSLENHDGPRLAARVLEAATDMDYAAAVEDLVFRRLGITATFHYDEAVTDQTDGAAVSRIDRPFLLHASAHDLGTLLLAIAGGEELGPEQVSFFDTAEPYFSPSEYLGIGGLVATARTSGRRSVLDSRGTSDGEVVWLIDPDRRMGVLVVEAAPVFARDEGLWTALVALSLEIDGESVRPAPPTPKAQALLAGTYVQPPGTYESPTHDSSTPRVFEVSWDAFRDPPLHLDLEGFSYPLYDEPSFLLPAARGRYDLVLPAGWQPLRFWTDGDGRPYAFSGPSDTWEVGAPAFKQGP